MWKCGHCLDYNRYRTTTTVPATVLLPNAGGTNNKHPLSVYFRLPPLAHSTYLTLPPPPRPTAASFVLCLLLLVSPLALSPYFSDPSYR